MRGFVDAGVRRTSIDVSILPDAHGDESKPRLAGVPGDGVRGERRARVQVGVGEKDDKTGVGVGYLAPARARSQ